MANKLRLIPFFFMLCFISCSGNNEPETPEHIEGINAIVPPTGEFAKDDGALSLNGSAAENVAALLTQIGPKIGETLENIPITTDQIKEIKTFTDALVGDAQSPKDIYEKIHTPTTCSTHVRCLPEQQEGGRPGRARRHRHRHRRCRPVPTDGDQ